MPTGRLPQKIASRAESNPYLGRFRMSFSVSAVSAPALVVMTPPVLAQQLGVTTKTLRNWRSMGHGPRFVKRGNSILYRPADVDAWLVEHLVGGAAA